MYPIFIAHLFVEEHLCCFHFLPVENRLAVNMDEKVSVEYVVRKFWHMIRLLGSYGHMLGLLFTF